MSDTMTAVYDLSRCPPTYDVVAFLSLLELERKRRGVESIDLHILPGPQGGFRADSVWPRSIPEREHLRDHVLVPICELLPSVSSVKVSDRFGSLLFDAYGLGEYLISLPNHMIALKAGSRPLRTKVPMRRFPNLVTITLREAVHWPLRNSQVAEWEMAAGVLRQRGYDVTVIRDTVCATHTLPNVRTDPLASINIHARAGLYASAGLNLGICNGPMWMAIAMDAPVLMLRPVTDAAGGCFTTNFFKRCGLNKGDQLPTSPLHQRLVWEDDLAENIIRAFDSMLETIEVGHASG